MTTGKVFAVHIQPADAAGRQITHGSYHASCHLLSTINRQAPLSAARNAKKDKSIRGIMTMGIQMTRNCFERKRFLQRAVHFREFSPLIQIAIPFIRVLSKVKSPSGICKIRSHTLSPARCTIGGPWHREQYRQPARRPCILMAGPAPATAWITPAAAPAWAFCHSYGG